LTDDLMSSVIFASSADFPEPARPCTTVTCAWGRACVLGVAQQSSQPGYSARTHVRLQVRACVRVRACECVCAMWRGEPSPSADVAGLPSPGADVAGVSPVPVQICQGRAHHHTPVHHAVDDLLAQLGPADEPARLGLQPIAALHTQREGRLEGSAAAADRSAAGDRPIYSLGGLTADR
jgi:hypothetical protein